MKRTKTPSPPTTKPLGERGQKLTGCGPGRWRPPATGAIIRPDSPESLLLALKEGRLDRRTSASRDLLTLRQAISQHPQEVARGLLSDLLAIRGVCLAAIIKRVTALGEDIIDDSGFAHPLIVRYLPETEKAIIAAAAALLKLEGHTDTQKQKTSSTAPANRQGSVDNGSIDVSTLVLQLSSNNGENIPD